MFLKGFVQLQGKCQGRKGCSQWVRVYFSETYVYFTRMRTMHCEGNAFTGVRHSFLRSVHGEGYLRN